MKNCIFVPICIYDVSFMFYNVETKMLNLDFIFMEITML